MQIIVLIVLKARHKYCFSAIPIISVQMFDLKDVLMLRILSYFWFFPFSPPTRQTVLQQTYSLWQKSINQSFGHLHSTSVLSSSAMLLEDLNFSQHWHGELITYRIKPGSLLGSGLQPYSSEAGVWCFHPDPRSFCYSSQSKGSLLTVEPARG